MQDTTKTNFTAFAGKEGISLQILWLYGLRKIGKGRDGSYDTGREKMLP
jgi:hypothetical protein